MYSFQCNFPSLQPLVVTHVVHNWNIYHNLSGKIVLFLEPCQGLVNLLHDVVNHLSFHYSEVAGTPNQVKITHQLRTIHRISYIENIFRRLYYRHFPIPDLLIEVIPGLWVLYVFHLVTNLRKSANLFESRCKEVFRQPGAFQR